MNLYVENITKLFLRATYIKMYTRYFKSDAVRHTGKLTSIVDC